MLTAVVKWMTTMKIERTESHGNLSQNWLTIETCIYLRPYEMRFEKSFPLQTPTYLTVFVLCSLEQHTSTIRNKETGVKAMLLDSLKIEK